MAIHGTAAIYVSDDVPLQVLMTTFGGGNVVSVLARTLITLGESHQMNSVCDRLQYKNSCLVF